MLGNKKQDCSPVKLTRTYLMVLKSVVQQDTKAVMIGRFVKKQVCIKCSFTSCEEGSTIQNSVLSS